MSEDYAREHAARVAAEAEADRLRSLCHEWEAAADAVTPSDHTPDALRRRGETLVTQANTQARTLSEVVALRSLLAAVARGELGSCFECWRFAMRAHANGDQCCDKHSDDNDPEAWSDLPHAAAIRGALKATKGER